MRNAEPVAAINGYHTCGSNDTLASAHPSDSRKGHDMTTSSVSPVTTELAGSETGITFIIHAGAGSRGKHSTPERIAQVELDLQRALDAGYQLLESGAPAHEAVVAAIRCRIVCVSPARTSRMPRRPLWTKSPRIMAMAA